MLIREDSVICICMYCTHLVHSFCSVFVVIHSFLNFATISVFHDDCVCVCGGFSDSLWKSLLSTNKKIIWEDVVWELSLVFSHKFYLNSPRICMVLLIVYRIGFIRYSRNDSKTCLVLGASLLPLANKSLLRLQAPVLCTWNYVICTHFFIEAYTYYPRLRIVVRMVIHKPNLDYLSRNFTLKNKKQTVR